MITRAIARSTRILIPTPVCSRISPVLLDRRLPPVIKPHSRRTFAAKTSADEIVEELQELYATAKDEFEIASEETEKKSVYAADDRAAAHEELAKFKEAYQKAIDSAGGEQIKTRIGSRVRELERAVEAMDEKAMED